MTSAIYAVYCFGCKEKIEIPFSDLEYQQKALKFIRKHRNCQENKEEYNKNKSCNCTYNCKYICSYPDEEFEKLYEFMNLKNN